MEVTSQLLGKESKSPLDGIHIRPHDKEANTVVIYDKYTALGHIDFAGDHSKLIWATPYRHTYLTCQVELPFKSMWDDNFTLTNLMPIIKQFLLKAKGVK